MTEGIEGYEAQDWRLVLASDGDLYTMWSERLGEQEAGDKHLHVNQIAFSRMRMSRSMSDAGGVRFWALVNDHDVAVSVATTITVNALVRYHESERQIEPTHVCRLIDCYTRPEYRGKEHQSSILKTLPYILGHSQDLPPPSHEVVRFDLAAEEWTKIAPAIISTIWTDEQPDFYENMSNGIGEKARAGWSMSGTLNTAWEIDMARVRTPPKDIGLESHHISWPQLKTLSTDLSKILADTLLGSRLNRGEALVAINPTELPRLTRLQTMLDKGRLVTEDEFYEGLYGIYLLDTADRAQDRSLAHKPYALFRESLSPDGVHEVLITKMGNITEEHLPTLLCAISKDYNAQSRSPPSRISLWGSLPDSVAAQWQDLGGRKVDRRYSTSHYRVGTSSWADSKLKIWWHDDQAWSFQS